MRIAIIVFPGSNCDHDTFHVINKILNIPVDFVWHRNNDIKKYDGIIIPGGFSYGDYLRTGAIARFSPIMESIINEANRGMPILGICNGFQILLESGLLPGSLIFNKNVRFLSKNISIKVASTDSIYTRYLNKGDLLSMPIAHKQGNYIVDKQKLKILKSEDRITFRYTDGEDGNPNGSLDCIAGVLNQNRNVMGMMPHPERASESILGSKDGLKIFKSMLSIC